MAEAHNSAVHPWNPKQNSRRQELANYLSLIMDINQCLVTTSTSVGGGHPLPNPWGTGPHAPRGMGTGMLGSLNPEPAESAGPVPHGRIPPPFTAPNQDLPWAPVGGQGLVIFSLSCSGSQPPVTVSLSASSLLAEWQH